MTARNIRAAASPPAVCRLIRFPPLYSYLLLAWRLRGCLRSSPIVLAVHFRSLSGSGLSRAHAALFLVCPLSLRPAYGLSAWCDPRVYTCLHFACLRRPLATRPLQLPQFLRIPSVECVTRLPSSFWLRPSSSIAIFCATVGFARPKLVSVYVYALDRPVSAGISTRVCELACGYPRAATPTQASIKVTVSAGSAPTKRSDRKFLRGFSLEHASPFAQGAAGAARRSSCRRRPRMWGSETGRLFVHAVRVIR